MLKFLMSSTNNFLIHFQKINLIRLSCFISFVYFRPLFIAQHYNRDHFGNGRSPSYSLSARPAFSFLRILLIQFIIFHGIGLCLMQVVLILVMAFSYYLWTSRLDFSFEGKTFSPEENRIEQPNNDIAKGTTDPRVFLPK